MPTKLICRLLLRAHKVQAEKSKEDAKNSNQACCNNQEFPSCVQQSKDITFALLLQLPEECKNSPVLAFEVKS